MSDIDLYLQSTGKHEELQEKRPDYVLARKTFLDLAKKYLKSELVVADFCCGTGNNTRLLAQNFSIKKATLVDINKNFLDIALKSKINAVEIVPVESDILKVSLKVEHDLVISMFAYHHVPNKDKAKYIEIIKDTIKVGGILLLGEIYSSDKETTLTYYKKLLEAIPENTRTPELEEFLKQTAESEDFEFKVSREFAHNQLSAAGFKLLESAKIWPIEKTFTVDVGTFVEVWQLTRTP